MSYTNYRGWEIYRGPAHPITGAWRARRAGVGMGAGTKNDLLRMIDRKLFEEQSERDRRSR